MMTAATIPPVKVLVVDDEKNICWVLKRLFTQKGYIVDEAYNGKEALAKLGKESHYNLIFLDIIMPDMLGFEVLDKIVSQPYHPPVVVMTAQSTMKNAVEAIKRGAFEYITKPFDIISIEALSAKALEAYEKSIRAGHHKTEKKQKAGGEDDYLLIGKTPVMNEIFKIIGKVADSDVTVIVQGERGTGKELVARAIHNSGKRAGNAFVSFNCAAIPRELLESELFGYEKGAFTGATERKIGKFEQAHQGTLFLDEIGDMSIDLQAKILRVLEEKEIVPVGGSMPVKIDVRIVAATNQDLMEMIKNKTFRADLYDRLNQVPIIMPTLRDRIDDIPVLTKHFLNKFANDMGNKKTITPEALQLLKVFDWPGNVRELQNAVRRAYLISPSNVLDKQDFMFLAKDVAREEMVKELSLEEIIDWKLEEVMRLLQTGHMDDIYDFVISQVEKPLIKRILAITNGNQIKAARLLGLNRNTLRKKIKQFDLVTRDFKKRRNRRNKDY